MRKHLLVLLTLFTLGACASTQRTLSYSAGWPDADVMVGAQRFQVWFHDRDRTVLVQRGDPRPLGQLLAENLTVYAQDSSPGILTWGAAANAVLSEIGCSPTEVTGSDQMRRSRSSAPRAWMWLTLSRRTGSVGAKASACPRRLAKNPLRASCTKRNLTSVLDVRQMSHTRDGGR
ncbi:MAG: hypothetical protein R3C16_11765 [Hyphomonadaceae bacterium]